MAAGVKDIGCSLRIRTLNCISGNGGKSELSRSLCGNYCSDTDGDAITKGGGVSEKAESPGVKG